MWNLFWVGEIPWKRDRLPTPVFLGFPGGSDGEESACNAGDPCSIPGLGRSPGGGHDNPLQYSCLENPHGQRSLAGYSQWGRKELDSTERVSTGQHRDRHHSKKTNIDTSLVVQWLRICLVMQETRVPSLVRELRSHMPQSNGADPPNQRVCGSQRKIPRAAAKTRHS